MSTELVLDTLDHAILACRQARISDLSELVHHTDTGSPYTWFAFTIGLLPTTTRWPSPRSASTRPN
ncbi:hypothetical protein [Jiangella anatolica]|uniref:hypothetical protein n=1 Tax=Jiangella anatolica TaxID=2670374 RepID=UPI0018F507D0